MSSAPRNPRPIEGVQTPTQARARRTLNRILDATESLLVETTLSSLPLSVVLKTAGVSNGAFYTRFRDKEALSRALFARLHQESSSIIERSIDFQNWRGRSPREVVSLFVREVLAIYRTRLGVIRALLDRSRHDGEHRATAIALLGDASRFLTRALYQTRPGKPNPAFEGEVRFAVRTLFAVLNQELLFGPAADAPPARRERFERELETRLTLLMLRATGQDQLL